MPLTNRETVRQGIKTPSTQSSSTEDAPVPTDPTAVAFLVGNPNVPDYPEYSAAPDADASPPPVATAEVSPNRGGGTTQQKEKVSLQKVQGREVPSRTTNAAIVGDGGGAMNPNQNTFVAPPVPPPPAPPPPPVPPRQRPCSKERWALLGAVLLIVILVAVIIAVVLTTRSSGGNGGVTQKNPNVPTPSPQASSATSFPTFVATPMPSPSITSSPPNFSPFSTNPTAPLSQEPTPLPTLETLEDTSTSQPTVFLESQTLENIATRGFLLCGVRPGLAGFSTWNGTTYEGFEADLCRAIAAAVLESAENLEFVEVDNDDAAFSLLQLGGIDVLASHITPTMERDVFESTTQAGFTFSVPYLYDGLSFGGLPSFADCADSLNATVNCTDLSICTLDGSPHSSLISELLPDARQVLLPSVDSVYDTFDAGSFCNAIAGTSFEVSEAAVRNNGYTGNYSVGVNLFSREPLSLVTRDDDPSWSDMVQWVLQALLAAEEQGVTMETTSSFATTEFFGNAFSSLFRNAIAAVGSYADMYARHLENYVPRTSINMINQGNTPLIYSLPLGDLTVSGPEPISGGTLERIVDRGHLRCGITRAPGFAEFDADTGQWSGLDIDLCRAVSAAIFNGVSDDIDFRVLPSSERFKALASGAVDLLARTTTWNLERDINETATGLGYSFSYPYFYDGVAVGGVPPYGACADILDTSSTSCADIKICVISSTTTFNVIRSRFAERFLVPQLTQDELVGGLSSGACNVIAGGIQQVVESSVRDNGYTGDYETGQNRFSKDPLALVMRQDDPQFTSFVNWIVTATFYAEEQGITSSDAESMGLVSLFGPLFGRMLIDTIQAVGNYGEIYERHIQDILARGGLNEANTSPFGPQHYPLPGI